MAASAAYNAKLKVGSDVAAVQGQITVPQGKAPIEISAMGDGYRSFLIGLRDRQDITFETTRNHADAAYAALQVAWTAGSSVTLDILDAGGSTAFKAGYLIFGKNGTFALDGAEMTEWQLVQSGTITTDAV